MSPLSVRDIEELRDGDWIYVINLEMAAREGLVGNLSKCGTYVMVNKLVDQENEAVLCWVGLWSLWRLFGKYSRSFRSRKTMDVRRSARALS